MTRREHPGRRVERDLDVVPLPRANRLRLRVRASVGEVEGRRRDHCRCPVGRHVTQLADDIRDRSRRRDGERHARLAKDLEPARERLARVHERVELVRPLVCGVLKPGHSAPAPRRGPDGRPVEKRVASVVDRLRDQRAARPEEERSLTVPGHRPRALGSPVARRPVAARVGRVMLLHVERQRGLGHDARIDALEPVVEPSHGLRHESDPRFRHPPLGKGVRPRPDHGLLRSRHVLEHSQRRVDVAVHPAAHDEHGALDPIVVRPQRGVTPVRPVGLVLEPRDHVRLVTLKVRFPDPREVRTHALVGRGARSCRPSSFRRPACRRGPGARPPRCSGRRRCTDRRSRRAG